MDFLFYVWDDRAVDYASFCFPGAIGAESSADVASKNKVIVTMLPSSSNVAAVYTGKDGVLRFLYFSLYQILLGH